MGRRFEVLCSSGGRDTGGAFLSDRMAEQGGLVGTEQLKVKLESEVPGLGRREGKQPLSVCPQLLGELWLSKEQGQMREKPFVPENLCHQIPSAAADSYLSSAAVCRCEADTEICLIHYSYLQRFNKKMCGLLQIISPILLAMKLTAERIQMHQLYKFVGYFHVSI